VIVDALVSPPYYRLLFALSPLDDAALNDLLETVWRGCRRSDALPSTAHTAAAARSITASNDHRAPTKPQSTIQYRHRPRSPTELSVQQMSANRPGAFASTTRAH